MLKAALSNMVVVVATMSLIACSTNTPNENVGMATGAIAGGLLGTAIGAGTGQAVAIGAGAVAGALIGGAVGRSMDDGDRIRMTNALDHNQRTYWVNRRTHVSYRFVPVKWVHVDGYNRCRRFYTVMNVNGNRERMYGTACRRNGIWRAV